MIISTKWNLGDLLYSESEEGETIQVILVQFVHESKFQRAVSYSYNRINEEGEKVREHSLESYLVAKGFKKL